MKVTSIDIFELHVRDAMVARPVVCRVNTDEGISGYGEVAISYGKGATAAFGMIKDLSPLVIGSDPFDTEVIWDRLYKSTFWAQNGGPIVFAGISALDIALWDIKGKALGLPVYKLLGGKKRDKLRTYASQLQFGWHDEMRPGKSIADYEYISKKAVSEGYDAIKIDFFTYDEDGRPFTDEDTTRLLSPKKLRLLEDRIAAVRTAVGKGVDIIIENHSNTDADSAVQIGQMAEKYRIFYFEEPNTPTPKMTRYIADKVNIPIASGERIYSRWQYAPYFENGSLGVIQPDLGNCGGITEGKKICDMAYAYDVSVQVHVCASPISVAATLQLEAVIPNFCIHEHHMVNTTHGQIELGLYDYQPKGGYFEVPELPGIGNELSEGAIKTADLVTVK
jgi:L-alanine-DL-glutamate epimerase-like enolase superfamily enzyme